MQVCLRAVQPSDLPVFFEHQSDVEAASIAGSTVRTRPAFDEHWRKIVDGPEFTVRAIEVNGKLAGYVSAFPESGRSEIAYWIGRKYWRKGVGRSAVSTFLLWYRERPIFGSVTVANDASLTILRRCGFTLVADETGADGSGEYVLRLN